MQEEPLLKKRKKIFMDGAIQPGFISDSIAKHRAKIKIGAHDIFLGQVRGDTRDGKQVTGIEYSTYREMAEATMHNIREQAFEKFNLECMHVYHSLGLVKTGEICLFVFVSSAHRQAAFDASRFIVEKIKSGVPVFGKEILEDTSYTWKKNT